MDKALFDQLNGVYAPLSRRAAELTRALNRRGIETGWGWYNNHSVMLDGEYRTEEFPIPVVEVSGLCDVGFDLDVCWLEFQLTREQSLAFDWEQLPPKSEVYGVDDYLHDFFRAGMDREGIAERIAQSGEEAVNVALSFPAEPDADALLAAVERCRRWKSGENTPK